MKRFARLFVVALGLAILGLVVTLVPNKDVSAQSPTQVQVVNTPLPVTATVTRMPVVSGRVAITNPYLSVRDIDNPSNEPFAASLCSGVGQTFPCFLGETLPSQFGVPTTTSDGKTVKELVIQYLDGSCGLSPGGVVTSVTLNTQTFHNVISGQSPAIFHFLTLTQNPTITASGQDHIFEWATPTQIFVDPDTPVIFSVASQVGTNYGCTLNLSGYLVTQ
jgi:hypothetical protein